MIKKQNIWWFFTILLLIYLVYVYRYLERPEKGVGFLGTGGYKLMDMGVGNQTQVLCQSSVSLNHWAISTITYLEISFDLTYTEWGGLLNLLKILST